MKIDQHDVASLSDDDIVRLVAKCTDLRDEGGPHARFWTEFGFALIRARRERRLAWLLLESELNDDGEIGEIVPDGRHA